MREPKFRIGDIVTFKSWEDMEAEYGSPHNVPFKFCSVMRHLCGKSFKVRSVEWSPFYDTYRIKLINDDRYNYSEEMFVAPSQFSCNDDVIATAGIGFLF